MKPELLIQSLSFSEAEILAEAIHRDGESLAGEVNIDAPTVRECPTNECLDAFQLRFGAAEQSGGGFHRRRGILLCAFLGFSHAS